MNQTPPANNQLCNQDVAQEQVQVPANEESSEPLVQPDEEDIQPDTSLVPMQDIGKVSDDAALQGTCPPFKLAK